jgi:cell division topological specificity factor
MSIFDLFRKRSSGTTASLAKDRLQVIIAREGHGGASSELVLQIKQAVMEAISRFVNVSPEDISVERNAQNDLEMLSVSISLPGKRDEAAVSPAERLRAMARRA